VDWVEASGKSLTEARDSALDLLGVAEDDAEFVVVSEPKAGLFGRVRGEARVQARVRPMAPPPKRGRRQRPDAKRGGDHSSSGNGGGRQSGGSKSGGGRPSKQSAGKSNGSGSEPETPGKTSAGTDDPGKGQDSASTGKVASGGSSTRRRRRGSGGGGGGGQDGEARNIEGGLRPRQSNSGNGTGSVKKQATDRKSAESEDNVEETLTLEQQGDAAKEFVSAVIEKFGLTASIEVRELDEDTVEVVAGGDDLGLLVGPRGATLSALQDLTRTFVQRQSVSRTDRILIDVAGYREKRTAALRRFTRGIVDEVKESGEERALEPMTPADRKVVHDAVNEIDGVQTRSEGEEPSRHIVIEPVS
jgi:spoIIIJ-associated protein